jgi:uncharacterized protein YjbJ (UPF0337 family)
MDKDKIKGTIDDVKGRVKRQTGEWTGDEKLQSEGATDQAKGKVEKAWGNVKEGARELKEDVKDLGRDVEHDEVKRKKDRDDAA